MPSLAPSAAPSPTVLVIDDSPELRDFVELLLTDAGYTVMTAASLVEAAAQLALRKPDLVIADVCLPDAPPFAVLDLLAADAATRDLPLLVCTGAVLQVDAAAQRLGAAGAGVVLKPFDIDTFVELVRQRCLHPAAPAAPPDR